MKYLNGRRICGALMIMETMLVLHVNANFGCGTNRDPYCCNEKNEYYNYCALHNSPECCDDCFRGGCEYLEMEWLGWKPSGPLGKCQGDCDQNSDCESGLICVHNKRPSGCLEGEVYTVSWSNMGGDIITTIIGDYCGDKIVNAAAEDVDSFDDDLIEENELESDKAQQLDNDHDVNSLVFGAVIGVIAVMVIVVLFLVLKRWRKRAEKETSAGMGKVVDAVNSVHVADDSTEVTTATGSVIGMEKENVTEIVVVEETVSAGGAGTE